MMKWKILPSDNPLLTTFSSAAALSSAAILWYCMNQIGKRIYFFNVRIEVWTVFFFLQFKSVHVLLCPELFCLNFCLRLFSFWLWWCQNNVWCRPNLQVCADVWTATKQGIYLHSGMHMFTASVFCVRAKLSSFQWVDKIIQPWKIVNIWFQR